MFLANYFGVKYPLYSNYTNSKYFYFLLLKVNMNISFELIKNIQKKIIKVASFKNKIFVNFRLKYGSYLK